MNEVIIVGDTHFGARGDNQAILENSIEFFENILFPYVEKTGIKTIIHMGDVMDKRKSVDILTLKNVKKRIFDRAVELGIKWEICMGNHDAYYRYTNDIAAVELLLREYFDVSYDNIKFYKSPTYVNIGDRKFLFLPWITPENYDQSLQMVKEQQADYIVGHLEINGFQMVKGTVCENGLKPSLFKNYIKVFSGHFHIRSYKDNIFYVGTPYELNWNDYGNIKGFHTLNLRDNDVKFFKNPKQIFQKIEWKEDTVIDKEKIKDCFVKIYNKSNVKNSSKFDEFLKEVGEISTQNVLIKENISTDSTIEAEIDQDTEDTLDFIKKYIEKMEDIDKAEKISLKALFTELFREAQ